MTRMLVMNDPHFTHYAPECRADTYPKEILAKFHDVARIAKRLGAKTIGCTGDWFHRKGKTLYRESNDLLSVLNRWREEGISVVGILGNHDIAGHSLDSLDNRAVGALVHSRVLQLLDHGPYLDGDLGVTGTSYFHGCDASDESRVRMYGAERPEGLPEGGCHVHLAHGTLIQRGEFFGDYTVAPELVELLAERGVLPDVIVCGHLHFDEGIKLYDRPDGQGQVAVCRVGSLGRVSSGDFDRRPKALVIAVKNGGFVCKAASIGKDVLMPGEAESAGETAKERESRIQDFVRVLREEADEWELADHTALLRTCAEQLGHDDDALDLAIKAIEARQ